MRKKFQSQSTEELSDVLRSRRGDYRQDALEVVRVELRGRIGEDAVSALEASVPSLDPPLASRLSTSQKVACFSVGLCFSFVLSIPIVLFAIIDGPKQRREGLIWALLGGGLGVAAFLGLNAIAPR
jgi:hypothetical protein